MLHVCLVNDSDQLLGFPCKRRPQLHDASEFKVPGGMGDPYMVLAFFVFILWSFDPRKPILAQHWLATPLWFLVVGIFYRRCASPNAISSCVQRIEQKLSLRTKLPRPTAVANRFNEQVAT